MPYALTNLINGYVPTARPVIEGYVAREGEIVLSDAEYATKETWVWDSATSSLRAPTAADLLAAAKRKKEREIRNMADGDITNRTRASEREVVVFKAASGAVMTTEEQEIRTAMTDNYNAMKTKVSAIRSATTVAEVEAVTWP